MTSEEVLIEHHKQYDAMTPSPATRAAVIIAIACFVIVAGCDVLDQNETVILRPNATYEFLFDVEPGDEATTAQSVEGASISQLLENTFRSDEVISASVTSVELRRLQPPNRNLASLFDSATLDLRNGNSITVASLSSPPQERSGQMNVSGSDVAGLFQGNAISAELELDLATEEREQYAIEARVQFRIEVEGV